MWAEAENSCGGTSVEPRVPGALTSVTYSFDRAGKLVGALFASDTDNGECHSFDTLYGKRCEIGARTDRDCPSAP